jgi:hypothetical protein
MTLFYVILIRIWKIRFNIKEDKGIRVLAGILVASRIILVLCLKIMVLYDAPVRWAIYRNNTFYNLRYFNSLFILKVSVKYKDKAFKNIGIGIIISFACYLPVVCIYQHI